MKNILAIILLLFISIRPVFSQESISSGQVIKLIQESPIFSEPASHSKIVADADKGTVLILRKKSSKGLWLLVEDEDRNQGWVPKMRTDFVEFQKPLLKNQNFKSKENEDTESGEINPEPKSYAWNHALGLTGRRSLFDLTGEYAWGIQYTLLSPSQFLQFASGENYRAFRSGFMVGFLEAPSKGFIIPFRFRLLAGTSNSSFSSGPDMGVLLMKPQERGLIWSWGIGYSFAWIPFSTTGVYLSLRAALDFRFGTRFSYELSVGYIL